MIGWLIVMGICAAVFTGLYIGRYSGDEAAATVGKGVGTLLIGFVFLEMTAAEMIAFNRDWQEMLEDAEFVYYLLRFGGWACIAWGAAQLVFAVILKVQEGKEVVGKYLENLTKQNEEKPDPAPASVSVQRPAYTQAAQTDKKDEKVTIKPEDGSIRCPKCGMVQGASRKKCWECGVTFEVE